MNNSAKSSSTSPDVGEIAPVIFAEINKAKSVLLCCHPFPDPDSVGSNLAMKFALESLGKKVTVIQGDTNVPLAYMHFPGADSIVKKNLFEINFKDYDLFISLDSPQDQLSKIKPIDFPLPIRSISIDHHSSGKTFADINLVINEAPATAEIIYKLLNEWKIVITPEIAANIFVATYFDTLFLKLPSVTPETFSMMSALSIKINNRANLLSRVESSETPETLLLYGKAFSSVTTFLNGNLAISRLSYDDLVECGMDKISKSTNFVSNFMKMVYGWKIVVAIMEIEPGYVKCSLRSNDVINYPIDQIAMTLGGGGHKGAAGIKLKTTPEEAARLIVEKTKALYNL